ncbi:MAG: FliM/FliN family flagellar motor switch protein, partial [Candidatus Margulisbacteria bacterium]|nr:FliM/FliN family flagellar motor switch protein [Candidatus Margulisiibacteriota bacterium]
LPAKVYAPFIALLGETSLTTGEIHKLEVGDVVSLDTPINSPLPTSVGENVKLLSQPGNKNRKFAIRLVGLKEAAEVELPPPELAAIEPKKEAAPKPPVVPPPKPPAAPPIRPAVPPRIEKPAPLPPPKEKPLEEEFGEDIFDEDLLDEEFPEDFNEEESPEDKI